MPAATTNHRQRRIVHLCENWGIAPAKALPSLPAAAPLPSFRTPADDQLAEDFLQRRAADAAQLRPKGVIRQAFSRKGKTWDPNDVLDALTTWVANAGSPGVAEALAAKLVAAGVHLVGTPKQKGGGIRNKRRNDEPHDVRVRLLRLAVVGKNLQLAQVLLPYADPAVLDTCLPYAIRGGDTAMAELLLVHGASAAHSSESQDALRQACTIHGQAQMVSLVLRSVRHPEPSWTSTAMCDAARAGCFDAVLLLSRSTANGNHNQAEALRSAVSSGRQDIALAIIIGSNPPQRSALNDALITIQRDSSLQPAIKLELVEILLCGGAGGVTVSQVLESYYQADFLQMAALLAQYGAAAEYEDGNVLKSAITRGQMNLVQSFLRLPSVISPSLASTCVSLIPKDAPFEQRHASLGLLLRQGAAGAALDEMLVDVAKAGDVASVDLLLTPFFPAVSPRSSHGRRSPSPNRHAVASVDHNSGEALRTALLRADLQMTRKMLSRQPSQATLTAVFPLTKQLDKEDRCLMTELFLQSSLPGPCLQDALVDAVNEPERDVALIKLLLKYDAHVSFSHGTGLSSLIKQTDLELLDPLLQKVSPKTAAAHLQDMVLVSDRSIRVQVAAMLLSAGADKAVDQVASTLLAILSEDPVDLPLLGLLVQQGHADINLLGGAIINRAVVIPEPEVLELVINQGEPSTSSITRALRRLMPLPSTEDKARKLETLLYRSTRKQDVDSMLVHEVKSLAQDGPTPPTLSSLKQLLAAGANPNAHNAAALSHAVIGANAEVVDTILGWRPLRPTPSALGVALPHALRITEPTKRHELTRALVQAGVLADEASRALTYAISNLSEDLPLISVLAACADPSDGEALALSASKESPEIMDALLSTSKSSEEARNSALGLVMAAKNQEARGKMCRSLVTAGVSAEAASKALLSASRDADLDLCDMLVAHGAVNGSHGGQAVVEACRRGSAAVLRVLLKAFPETDDQNMLKAGFQAATEVGDLNKRAVIFEQLLGHGLGGDLVDAQLQSAARYGEDGIELLRVLLAFGADPNYNNGDCVFSAASCAFVATLDLLLGLECEGEHDGGEEAAPTAAKQPLTPRHQKQVSQHTLLRALGACWSLQRESRYHIACSLFKAGLRPSKYLDKALNDAVNEEDAEERLVKLLLENGASASVHECKSLKDAAKSMTTSTLALILETDLPEQSVEEAFSEAFSADGFDNWFTDAGLGTARLLLNKVANAQALSRALILVMKNSFVESRALADSFFDLLVAHQPDIDYNGGQVLQQAASKADQAWTERLLGYHPSADTLSSAFQCIFDTETSQEIVLDLFKMFTEYRDGEVELDVAAGPQGYEPMVKRAISQYPRSTVVLETLLNAGFYHDQATKCLIYPEIEEDEEATLLLWAIAQPQKRVSTAVIKMLIERGGEPLRQDTLGRRTLTMGPTVKVNAESSATRTTPLMLATQNRRPDLVKSLIDHGADGDALDSQGRTSLCMAANASGEVAVQLLTILLAAEPSKDDGSLHNAARNLNLPAVTLLVQAGHDPDFPSPLHGGRSALGEVCLHGSDAGDLTALRERAMLKIMGLLMGSGSDLTIKSNGKSFLLLCFEAADPVVTTRALLKSGMWKHVNKPFNRFTVGEYTYSPTMYISKVLGPSSVKGELLSALRASRAIDMFYASQGPQPEGAVGLPEEVEAEDRARRARLSRLAMQSEDLSIAMACKRQMADVERQIAAQQEKADYSRRRKLHGHELASIRSRAEAAEAVAASAHERRLAEHRALADASLGSAKALAESELEAEEARRRKALDWEQQINSARVGHVRTLSSINMGEMQVVERIEKDADRRIGKRLAAQRLLVESQDRLAGRLRPATAMIDHRPRTSVGYVTELD
ncbi:hypothetical protein L249_3974 [Ophiocordyceps polyrhachis-furcata BCC 54312]|uniref:Uncharacterized protein n=1 Tax=Ophiocordyceps polyrhachis-furcata BCC 54312 TaxID=1330021 RepID=A0A367L5K9_9HYPO|nr:hypothetical protein L249_3974 [Ophiocordyceps polyrhachis-furcata BCC 54312]